jgi:hypothetical protein
MKTQNSKLKTQKYRSKVKSVLTFEFLLAILPFAFLLFPLSASGQERKSTKSLPIRQAIRVTPIISTPLLIPGKTVQYGFQIDNMLDQPIGITASLAPLDASDENTGMRFDKPIANNELIKWSTLSQKSFIIPASQSYFVSMSIATPLHPKSLQQNAVLFLTPFLNKPLDPNTPTVISKIGVLILAHVGDIQAKDIKKAVSIPTFTFGGIVENAPAPLLLRIANNFAKIVTAKPFIEIHPLCAHSQKIDLEEKRILPGHIRRWQEAITLSTNTCIFYKTTVKVSLGEGEQIVQTTYFLLFPLKKVLAALGVAFLLIIIIKRRKQLQKAGQILLIGDVSTTPPIKAKKAKKKYKKGT